MIIQPVQLTGITSIPSFLDGNGAMEAGLFSNLADKAKNLSTADLAPLCDSIDMAVYDWEHSIAVDVDTVMKKVLKGNTKEIKQLKDDLKTWERQAKEYKKQMNASGLPDTQIQSATNAYYEMEAKIEDTKNRLTNLQATIFVTEDVYNAVKECMGIATKDYKILAKSFARYTENIKIKDTKSHPKHDPEKATENFRKFLGNEKKKIQHNSEFRKTVDHDVEEIDKICRKRIYGKTTAMDPTRTAKLDVHYLNEIVDWYKNFRTSCGIFHKRLARISKGCRAKPGGAEALTLLYELEYLEFFIVCYNDLMTSYIRAPLAVVNSLSE